MDKISEEISPILISHYIKMFRWNSFNTLYRLEYPVSSPENIENMFCFIAA